MSRCIIASERSRGCYLSEAKKPCTQPRPVAKVPKVPGKRQRCVLPVDGRIATTPFGIVSFFAVAPVPLFGVVEYAMMLLVLIPSASVTLARPAAIGKLAGYPVVSRVH